MNFYRFKLTSNRLAFLMSAVAGFSDVFGFIALSHLFTAHITGNIAIIISYFLYNIKGTLPEIMAIPLFIVFSAIISFIIESRPRSNKHPLVWLMIETGFFIFFLFFGVTILDTQDTTSLLFCTVSMLPVCAMAIHNTLLKTYMSSLPPCTVMTGNLTQFIVDLSAFLKQIISKEKINKNGALLVRIFKIGSPLLGFILGGTVALTGYIFINFWAILFAILTLIFIVFLYRVDTQAATSS